MLSKTKAPQSGFSLIELIVTIVVLGISLAIAVPSFQAWLQNSQIRNAAESIQNGLQRARAEAVTRNTSVEFVLGNNSAWIVRLPGSTSALDSRTSNEGSSNVIRTVIPATASTVTFNNLGGITANADASPAFSQIDLSSATLPAPATRPLRITLGIGGNIRMCDPNAPASSLQAC